MENGTLKLKSQYENKEYEVKIIKSNYLQDHNLYIGLVYRDYMPDFCNTAEYWAPYCDITVNITKLPDNQACIDVNNLGDYICDWLIENKLAKPTNKVARSGFCTYPIFEFDLNEVNKYLMEA